MIHIKNIDVWCINNLTFSHLAVKISVFETFGDGLKKASKKKHTKFND